MPGLGLHGLEMTHAMAVTPLASSCSEHATASGHNFVADVEEFILASVIHGDEKGIQLAFHLIQRSQNVSPWTLVEERKLRTTLLILSSAIYFPRA